MSAQAGFCGRQWGVLLCADFDAFIEGVASQAFALSAVSCAPLCGNPSTFLPLSQQPRL